MASQWIVPHGFLTATIGSLTCLSKAKFTHTPFTRRL